MENTTFRNTIDSIKDKVDIVEIISGKIELKNNNTALCPFHDDNNPSFSVNQQGQYFHCFACGISGDVISFLMKYEHKSFFEVLSELGNRVGITIATLAENDKKQMEEERSKADILTATANFYHDNLAQAAKEYLINERKLTEETINTFLIGYANWNLQEHLVEVCKYPLELCIKSGVLKKHEGGSIKDFFYKRIIFPHFNRGAIVNLTGRSLDGSKPKYLHLPGEMKSLYNEEALHSKLVFMVEGILDCLSLHQLGYAAIALNSISLKNEFATKFINCETIYLLLDSDSAGVEGMIKVGKQFGNKAKVLLLPTGEDPNSFLAKHTKEQFDELVASAKDFIKYQFELIPQDTSKIDLPKRLDDIFQQLAGVEEVTAEAYLSYEIKQYFDLSGDDIKGYRKLVSQYRKEKISQEREQSENTGEKIEADYSASFPGLVDLVQYEDKVAFLIKEAETVSIKTSVQIGGKLYIPPPKEQIKWLLPSGEKVLKIYEEAVNNSLSDSQLFDDLCKYHKSISLLPNDTFYDLFAAWDMHTYLLEKVQYTPIICLFAEPERGKSRTGKGLIYVAYRGLHVESLRDAYIVRVADNFQSTIFFDVMDVWKKAEKTGTEDILLQRFEKGATVPRVLYPEKGRFKDTEYFSIFGATVIGTNVNVHTILETRAIQINMPETDKEFENDVIPTLGLPFKERLVAFRAKYMDKKFDDIPKPAKGRLGDILRPLLKIVKLVKPDREPAFFQLIQEIKARRLVEKSETYEAQILNIIIGFELEAVVNKGMVSNKDITDKLNDNNSNEKYKFTYKRISNLVKAMGFKSGNLPNGSLGFFWDSLYITLLKKKYGLVDISSEQSVSSESPESSTIVTDDTDHTDAENGLNTENNNTKEQAVSETEDKDFNLNDEDKFDDFL